jgi:hypothetical protein
MKAQTKIDLINAAIARSQYAQDRQAQARMVGNRVRYEMLSPNGRYAMRVSFREIMNTLHGEDIRIISEWLKGK